MAAQIRNAQPGIRSFNNGVLRFRAQDCLLSTLWRVRDRNAPAAIKHADAGTIWLDPLRGYGGVDTRVPERLFSAEGPTVAVQWGVPLPEMIRRRPIEELYWQAAWYGSRGALLDGCHPYDVIGLRHWPNFTRLPFRQSEITLCALLHQRSSSLSFAFRSLKVPREDAFRFYSAAFSAGHIHVVSAQPGHERMMPDSANTGIPDESDAGSLPFWHSLFKKISGL